jgi:hypothetical protein
MSRKVPLGDEVSQNHLIPNRHVPSCQRQGGNKRIDQPLLARIFHPDTLTGIDQQTGTEVDPLLNAREQNNLLC